MCKTNGTCRLEKDTPSEVCIAWAGSGDEPSEPQGEGGLWYWLRACRTGGFWRTRMESLPPRRGFLTGFRKMAARVSLRTMVMGIVGGVPFGDRLKGFTSPGRRSHEKALVREERLEEALTGNA